MIGIHEVNFYLKTTVNCVVTRLVNIPDIHCVSHLAFGGLLMGLILMAREPRRILRFLKFGMVLRLEG